MQKSVLITLDGPSLEALIFDAVDKAIKINHSTQAHISDADPFGDFRWLQSICPAIPASTLRIKSAAGEIPGVVKFGKRVLYEKALVLNWLRSQTRQPSNAALIDQQAEEQYSRQLSKRGGVRA